MNKFKTKKTKQNVTLIAGKKRKKWLKVEGAKRGRMGEE